LNNLSLMALTIATGFVVDDAIVVLENISRHADAGRGRVEAALTGAREVGFTVLSISISLIAVFIPILLMGGIVGRLFREFALTLSLAILVSLALSLTLTPMMCALFLRPPPPGEIRRRRFDPFAKVLQGYERTLSWALRHGILVMVVLLSTVGLNVVLFKIVPKGFFPQQDTGRLIGSIVADQAISFQAMRLKLAQLQAIVQADPAIASVKGYTGTGSGGGAGGNTGSIYIDLKPKSQRSETADEVIARLRRKLTQVPGARLYLQSVQDIRMGGRASNAQYQFTLQGESTSELYAFVPRLVEALENSSVLADVNSDQQQTGLETDIDIDRDTASRLGIIVSLIDNTLYDAFGQRQVSTIYSAVNQYHVVMEVDPRYWQDPAILKDLYVSTSGASPSGTATTNAVAGTVTRSPAFARAGVVVIGHQFQRDRECAGRRGVQRPNQCLGQYRPGHQHFGRSGGQHNAGNNGSARRLQPFSAGPHALGGQPPGPVCGEHDFIQSASRRIAQRRDRGNPGGNEGAPRARHDPRQPARNRPFIRRVPVE
jgi:multidrug efflux pump